MTARPLNYTTKIDVKQTVGELTDMLGEHGASVIGVEYENRRPSGLTFVLDTAIGKRPFRLPVDPAGMHRESWAIYALGSSPLSGRERDEPTGLLGTIELLDVCTAAMSEPPAGDPHVGVPCDCGRWAMPGQAHWRVADPVLFDEPIPYRGQLGLWTVPDELLPLSA